MTTHHFISSSSSVHNNNNNNDYPLLFTTPPPPHPNDTITTIDIMPKRLSSIASPPSSRLSAPPIFAEDPPLPPIDLRDSLPFALRDVRSPSTSTISSGSWTDEPKQRSLVKQASLPVPCSPADAAPLPRRGRLPQAQVFVARPATPRGLSEFAVDRARLIAATRRGRPQTKTCAGSPPRMAPRSSSEVAPTSRTDLLRKSSSGYNHGNALRQARQQRTCSVPRSTEPRFSPPRSSSPRPHSPRVNTPAPRFWLDAARFESADTCDAHDCSPYEQENLEPKRNEVECDKPNWKVQNKWEVPKWNETSSSPYEPEQKVAASLRHLSLRRDEAWVLPVGGGIHNNNSVNSSSATAVRVMSFDAYRSSTIRSYVGKDRGDDYVGFIEVAPTKMQLWRIKSKQFFAKFLGRGKDGYHVRRHATAGVR